MPFTQAEVDALKAAIASGERRVRFSDGREVEYRTIDELKNALALAQGEVDAGASAPTGPLSRTTRAVFVRD